MSVGAKSPQLVEIASLASQLDKLVHRVLVPSLCLLPQLHQIGIKQWSNLQCVSCVNRTIPLTLPEQ